MSRGTLIDLLYLVSATTFIVALKGLGSPKRARLGNIVAAVGMLIAVVATFFKQVDGHNLYHVTLILIAMAIGIVVAVPTARYVRMTAMPQLVAIFNGVGGGAAALVSITEFMHIHSSRPATYVTLEVLLGVLIGTVSFSGSAIAFAKLQELMTGRPVTYPGQQVINAILGAAGVVLIIIILVNGQTTLLWVLLGSRVRLGHRLRPADRWRRRAGLDLAAQLLHWSRGRGLGLHAGIEPAHRGGNPRGRLGYLAHASYEQGHGPQPLERAVLGLRLGHHRQSSATGADARPVRSGSPEDAGVLLSFASRVAIIPGYGLAVAQAQHVLRELAEELEAKGIEVFYAIHPVAGRMPGHMNVLLAEANVPYEQLLELDEANSELQTADVALVVGANDTVNPAAKDDKSSPIYGMPIINADLAENVLFLKRSMRPGFAGIENELLYNPKTTLIFGDAKDTLTKIVAAVKAN